MEYGAFHAPNRPKAGMTKKKTTLKREPVEGRKAPEPEPTFWQRIFGRKPVAKESLRLAGGAGLSGPIGKTGRTTPDKAGADRERRASATRPMGTAPGGSKAPMLTTMPEDLLGRPSRSFLTRKFNAAPVREALLEAIDKAIANPLESRGPQDDMRWLQGLAAKRRMIEAFDPASLSAEQQLRAVHWMSQIERLNPMKLTYWEDLVMTRHMLDCGAARDEAKPAWLAEIGITVRRLTQAIQQREANRQAPDAVRELAALVPLFEGLCMLPTAQLREPFTTLVRDLCRELDPMKPVYHGRHPRFERESVQLRANLQRIQDACGTLAPESF